MSARAHTMKSPRLASKRRPDVRELDALCREVVFLRDQHRCCRCHRTTRLQWCHVHTRRIRSLRWRLENSLLLCAGCHLWWHHHPLESAGWFEDTYPEEAETLSLLRQTKQKPDLAAIRLYLLQEQAKLAGEVRRVRTRIRRAARD